MLVTQKQNQIAQWSIITTSNTGWTMMPFTINVFTLSRIIVVIILLTVYTSYDKCGNQSHPKWRQVLLWLNPDLLLRAELGFHTGA